MVCSGRSAVHVINSVLHHNTSATREKRVRDVVGMTTKGVLGQLSALETRTRRTKEERPTQQSRVEQLRAEVEALLMEREQLKAQISVSEKLPDHPDQPSGDGEDLNSQLEQLRASHAGLKSLLHAHRLIGGYDIIKTRQGKGACISIATSYHGAYLERYSLELQVAPVLRIIRHDVPPFVPLAQLAERGHALQNDLRGFLASLSRHLDAYAGRKQQLRLLMEQHKSVEVMESNAMCSILVLMLTVPKNNVAILCKLDYSDHTCCLPEEVTVQSEDKDLPETTQWKNICTLLKETPLHKAVTTMIQNGDIK